MTKLFPGTQCGIGPPTDEGFFYDFVVERPFVPEDLEAIEKKMKELAGAGLVYERQMWPREEAIEFFRERGEPLKVQLIEEKTGARPTSPVYTIKDRDTFVDFCVGPHVPSTRQAEGVQAADHVERLLEGRRAQSADAARLRHGVLQRQGAEGAPARRSKRPRSATTASSASELGLFMFHPWAPGAAFWLGKGTTLYNLLANYMRGVLFPAGYVEVKTPLVFNKALWETSGHWEHYRENMFLIESRTTRRWASRR